MITPQKNYPELARAVGVSSLYLKREDMHPYGSHKGRSIPVMIDHYVKSGKRHFAISSSGNAALAAAMYIRELNEGKNTVTPAEAGVLYQEQDSLRPGRIRGNDKKSRNDKQNLKLEILVGNHILDKKLKKLTDLADENISVMRFERPLQTLTQKTADGSIQSLRQSTDDIALIGYESLAEELGKVENLAAIFVATSSGTTAQALAEYFLEKERRKEGKKEKSVEIHIVQTTSCNPMALEFVDSVPSEDRSTADAIVDITALRKAALTPLVNETNGSGWIASNDEIETAQKLIKNNAKIEVSPNGALALAGLMQAAFTGKEFDGAVVCIIGGE